DPLFIPSPTQIILTVIDEINEGIFFSDIAVSFYRITAGFLISTVFALCIGVMVGMSNAWQAFWNPIVSLPRYFASVSFIPLSVLWFGTGDIQKFFILFLGVFFQQVIMIADNCKTVNTSLIEVGLTLGLKKYEVIKDI